MARNKVKAGELPSEVKGVRSGAWQSVVKSAQGNFDHLMGVIRGLVVGHNSLVDDVDALQVYTEAELRDTSVADHTHQNTGGGEQDGGVIYAAGIDHGGLAGLADEDHAAYIAHSVADAVGDLLVGSAANDFDRLPKGTNGQVLTVDDTETLDVKWAIPDLEFGTEAQTGTFLTAKTTGVDAAGYGIDLEEQNSAGLRIRSTDTVVPTAASTLFLRPYAFDWGTDSTSGSYELTTPNQWLQAFEGDALYLGSGLGFEATFPEAGTPSVGFAGTWTFTRYGAGTTLATLDQSGNLWVLGAIDGGAP